VTAIYLVWNPSGLAIAGDRAISVVSHENKEGERETLFTYEAKKIFLDESKRLIIASADEVKINNVRVGDVIAEWMKSTAPRESLFDYAESFIHWLSEVSSLETAQDVAWVESAFESQFRVITEAFDDKNRKDLSRSDIIREHYEYWKTIRPFNILGNSLEKDQIISESLDRDELYGEFCARFQRYTMSEQLNEHFLDEMHEKFSRSFSKVFTEISDLNANEIDLLRTLSIDFNSNYISSVLPKASLMFAGYGTKDWLPLCVKMDVYQFETTRPLVSIKMASSPLNTWFIGLAQEGGWSRYWRPVEDQILLEVKEKLLTKFKNRPYVGKVIQEIDDVLGQHTYDKINPIREKIDSFPVQNLAFLASQMVALESLNSFIEEHLPGVGGKIDVVTMTKTTTDSR
jgi:hypothetical protein